MSYFYKIFIVTVFFSTILKANIQNFKFEHLSSVDGLSQNNIHCIFQDHQGFIWFGTSDGLNKYDGYKFTVYYHDQKDSKSISNEYITSIAQDKMGNIWVGTANGLNRFDQNTETFNRYFHSPENKNSINNNYISALYIDSSNTLWIGTSNGGLTKISNLKKTDTDGDGLIFKHFLHDSSNPNSICNNDVKEIYEDKSNFIWIGTANGLNKFDKTTETFTRYMYNSKESDNNPNKNVSAIYEDNLGNIWIGTWYGYLFKFDQCENRFFPYKKHNIKNVVSIVEDRKGALWLGTIENVGLIKLDHTNNEYTVYPFNPSIQFSLKSNYISSLYVDISGILWIGTYYGGIHKLDRNKEKFKHFFHSPTDTNSLSHNNIFSICEDNSGKVWIATWGNGLDYFDPETGIFKNYNYDPGNPNNSLSSDYVRIVVEDSYGIIWIGTSNGLNRFDRKTESFVHYKTHPEDSTSLSYNYIYYIFEDQSRSLWIATYNGLNKYDRKTEKFIRYYHDPANPKSLGSNYVKCIYEDNAGILWIAARGLNKYNPETDRFIRYQHDPENKNSLNDNGVVTIYEDRGNNLWIGTYGGGLDKFDKHSESFTHYTTKDGLPSNVVYGISEDSKENLWLSTNNGISKFNTKTNSFRNYKMCDGIQGKEFNQRSFYKGSSGRYYFGGINGFNIFYPDSIVDNSYIPSTVITFMNMYDQSSQFTIPTYNKDSINLTHRNNVFSFDFVALNYTNSQENQYAYKMEGFDENWIYCGTRRQTTYTNLEPGEYVFKVKGSNNDGIWNEAGTSLTITISPPWWATTYAYIVYGLLFLLSIYAIREYEIRRIRMKHNLEIKEKETEKLEAINTEKSRFFAGISHEFRTPLTLILGPVERLIRQIKNEKQCEDLQHIKDNARRMNKLVDMYLDLSMLESGTLSIKKEEHDILCIINNVLASFASMAADKKINLRFNSNLNAVICKIEKEKLEQIIINLVNNAIKFTPAEGNIDISIEPEPSGKNVILTVSDTGIGIAQEQLDKIFDMFYQVDNDENKRLGGTGIGLAMVKELVRLHNGEILVKSQLGQGTEFSIKIPVIQIDDGASNITVDNSLQESESDGDIETDDGIRILIVEDNSEMREYIRSLVDTQHKAETCRDGVEGIEKAITFLPDLIISDVMMPNMDGYEFVDKIKNDLRTSHVPVILLTAKTNQPDKLKGLKTGADAYITKPFNPDELTIHIESLLENRERIHKKFRQDKYFNPSDLDVTTADEKFLQKCHQAVEENLSNPDFSMEKFASEVHLSRTQLHKKLKSLTGLSATEYVKTVRLKKAAILLETGFGNIAEIAYETGFSNPSYFAECFKKFYNISPLNYTKNHKS